MMHACVEKAEERERGSCSKARKSATACWWRREVAWGRGQRRENGAEQRGAARIQPNGQNRSARESAGRKNPSRTETLLSARCWAHAISDGLRWDRMCASPLHKPADKSFPTGTRHRDTEKVVARAQKYLWVEPGIVPAGVCNPNE